jgi:DNA (cytosine-5)-methyltransferase 1
MQKRTMLTAIDLFAGAGGLSLAAINSGVEIRAAVENDSHAVATYKLNILPISSFPIQVEASDIRNVDWAAIMRSAELSRGECDILLGGPPCQGFSTHRINGAGIGDPRNELLLTYFEALQTVRPRSFLVENVTGILWQRHSSHIRAFLDGCKAAGYSVYEPVVLNARDYGVPQNRKRVFILGFRTDLLAEITWPPAPTHFDPQGEEVRASRGVPWATAAEVFRRPLDRKDPNAIHMNHTDALRRVFQSTPKNGGSRSQSERVLACHKDHNGHKDVYGRIDPRKPGPTMTTGCINPSKGRFVHPTLNHAITARHAARFQGFPDDFIFCGGLMASGQQIGNAVPVRLGEIVVGTIARAFGSAKRIRSAGAARNLRAFGKKK